MAAITFYKCKKCANFVATIEDGPCTPQCCGEPMDKLEAGVSDGATEKHVPVVTRADGRIVANVGEVDHPMLEAHSIQWIALVADGRLEIHKLKPGEAPQTSFADDGAQDVTVYEYCNLHGLWKADL